MNEEIGMERRTFLKTVFGAGIFASASLPAFAGRGKYEEMSLSYARIEAGAEKPFSVLHISDTHLAFAHPHESESLRKRAEERTELFGARQVEALEDSIRWAKKNTDYLFHTGDLIDFFLEANLECAKAHFPGEGFFGAIGNHEYFRGDPQKASDTDDYKGQSAGALQKNYPFNIHFASQVINGVNFVSLDDVFNYINADQATLFEAEVKKGLPIVLMMHVPFITPFINAARCKYWRYGMRFRAEAPKLIVYNKATVDFIAYLKAQPLLKGILAGHLHITVSERFSPTAMQYVVGGNFAHAGEEVFFT